MSRPDGFVLAGGASRRMGVDKARVPFPDRWPMAFRVLSALEPLCGRVALVRSGPDEMPWRFPDGREVPVIFDGSDLGSGDRHPLRGVVAGLRAATTEVVLFAPCDVPHLTTEVFSRLLDQAGERGAVVWDGAGVHPLIAAVPRARLADAERAVANGSAVRDFVAEASRVAVDPAVVDNINAWSQVGSAGPVRRLVETLSFLDDGTLQRVAGGERARLAARGVLDPDDYRAPDRLR